MEPDRIEGSDYIQLSEQDKVVDIQALFEEAWDKMTWMEKVTYHLQDNLGSTLALTFMLGTFLGITLMYLA